MMRLDRGGGVGGGGRHEGAGGERQQRARAEQPDEVGRERRQQIGDGKGGQRPQQQAPALNRTGQHRDNGRADCVSDPEHGDKITRLGDGYAEIAGDARQ